MQTTHEIANAIQTLWLEARASGHPMHWKVRAYGQCAREIEAEGDTPALREEALAMLTDAKADMEAGACHT